MSVSAQAKSPVYKVVAEGSSFAIHRDNAALKTRDGSLLLLPTQALAEAIAQEWRGQASKPNPDMRQMPLMQFAATAIDVIAKDRAKAIDQIMAYAESELLCHRAESHQPELAKRQAELWQPILDWSTHRFDAFLKIGSGIMPIEQMPDALKALRIAVECYDNFKLTGLQEAVSVSGSLVLGLALMERHLSVEQVFEASQVDETFQIGEWGEDPATAARREGIKRDLVQCVRWLELL